MENVTSALFWNSDAAEQFKVFGNSKSVFTIQKGYKMQFLLLPNKDFTNKVCSMHKDIMFLKELLHLSLLRIHNFQLCHPIGKMQFLQNIVTKSMSHNPTTWTAKWN